MSYTDPPDFNAGDVLTADELDVLSEDIRDLHSRVEGTVASFVQLSRSTNQAIATGIGEYIVWTTENIDVGGWWSSGDTIVTPASAVPDGTTTIGFEVWCYATFASNATGTRRVRAHVNGSSIGGIPIPAVNGDATVVLMIEGGELEALDEIQLEVFQNSGGPLNVTSAKVMLKRIGVSG